LSNSVISSAVLGFLILFNAREMCSSRRQREFGLLRISASSYRKMTLAYSDRGPDVAWVWRGCKPNSKSWLARRQQLAQQIPNRYRLVFSDAANQTVGALEALLVRFNEAGGAIVELDFTDSTDEPSVLGHLEWRMVVSHGRWAATPDPRIAGGRKFRMDLRSALHVGLSVETITGQGRSLERSDRTEAAF
jgi:hypothetical protein